MSVIEMFGIYFKITFSSIAILFLIMLSTNNGAIVLLKKIYNSKKSINTKIKLMLNEGYKYNKEEVKIILEQQFSIKKIVPIEDLEKFKLEYMRLAKHFGSKLIFSTLMENQLKINGGP